MTHEVCRVRSGNQYVNVVDLFAGAGGFSLAAVLAGAEIVFAVESDRHAAATYKKNIGKIGRSEKVVVYNNDIRELSAATLAATHFENGDSCDLLLGGPPCQGFSTHRINGSGIDDPRNKLLLDYFKFVVELKPRAFLVENVPGMLWPRHKKYVEEFYRLAKDFGYRALPPVKIDARDYGTPQRRHRVFVLGLRMDVECSGFDWPPPPTHSSMADEGSDGLKPNANELSSISEENTSFEVAKISEVLGPFHLKVAHFWFDLARIFSRATRADKFLSDYA